MLSLNKLLVFILVVALAALYSSARSPAPTHLRIQDPLATDAEVCAGLPPDPVTLPFVSYSSKSGFDACVDRCMTSVMMQVCRQLPGGSNIFATRPEVKKQMLAGCIENINHFIQNNTRCPYLNCKP